MTTIDDRLNQLRADVVTAGGDFDPLLHPRGIDGRFIEVGGWVRGLFRFPNGQEQKLNAKVTGFRQNKRDRSDLIVEAMTKFGPATALVSRIEKSLEPKGKLSKVINDVSQKLPWKQNEVLDKLDVEAKVVKAREPFEQHLARVNALAEKLHPTDPLERAKVLNQIMNGVRGSSMSTVYIYNKKGRSHDEWDATRFAQHQQLWESFLARVNAAGIEKNRDALVLGGLPGAGKTSSLRPGEAAGEFGIVGWNTMGDPPPGVTHIALDPDTIKELMINAGMLPVGVSPKIKPMEQVSFIHAESNFLVSWFFQQLADEGYNVVYDTTMANVPHVVKNISPMAENGYKFRGLFVDIPSEESKISALGRYAREFDPDDAMGSRFVPSEAGSARSSRGYNSGNRDVFEDMENWFEGGWIVVDNTGVSKGQPRKKIVARGVGDGSRTVRYREPKFSRPIPKGSKGQAKSQPSLWPNPQPEDYDDRPDVELTAKELTAKYSKPKPPPVQASAQEGEPFRHSTSQLLTALRQGEITVEDGLELLRADAIAVPDMPDDDYEVASFLPHELMRLGADQAMLDMYADEVVRLRGEGITMDEYIAEPVITAALDWDPLLHPRGRDGRFIEVGGWVVGIFNRVLTDTHLKHRGRVKVIRIDPNPDDPGDPFVIGLTDDQLKSEVSALASTLLPGAPTKANLKLTPVVDPTARADTHVDTIIASTRAEADRLRALTPEAFNEESGPVWTALWRQRRGWKPQEKGEADILMQIISDDPAVVAKAKSTLRRRWRKIERVSGKPSDWFTDRVTEAVAVARDNPKIAAMEERVGVPDLHVMQLRGTNPNDTPTANYLDDDHRITFYEGTPEVSSLSGIWAGDNGDDDWRGVTELPIEHGKSTGGTGPSVYRHEFGHHVQNVLDDDHRVREFEARWADYKAANEAVFRGAEVGAAGANERIAYSETNISNYSLVNWREGFAEAFRVVTNPFFDDDVSSYNPEAQDLLLLVMDLLETP